MVAMVVLSALTARELGGERRAQTVTALATATSILPLSLSATLATTAIDSAPWARSRGLGADGSVTVVRRRRPRITPSRRSTRIRRSMVQRAAVMPCEP